MTTTLLQLQAERVDDIPFLLGFLQRMDLPKILEQQLGSHHLHQGLSNGWLATVWIAFLLSEANHCKVSVQDWAQTHQHVLTSCLGQSLRAVEFSDDRLSIILRRFHDAAWPELETALWNGSCQVYEIPLEVVRLDATTSYGYHEITPEGLLQRGHSKDHRPDLPQFKLMAAAAQPTSQIIACDIAPGNSADDPLYLPLIERVRGMLGRHGLLYAGDCKMAALETRAAVATHQDYYLMPLPRSGETAALWDGWIDAALEGTQPLEQLHRLNEDDEDEVFAQGYEFVRDCAALLNDQTACWQERVQVVRSLSLADQQAQQLEERLQAAQQQLHRLTPPPGRGIRPYRETGKLQAAIDAILKENRVEGLLQVTWVAEPVPAQRTPMAGQECRPTTRYVIASVARIEDEIQATKDRQGWRVQVTNLPKQSYGLLACVLLYNGGWSVERDFAMLKGRPLGIQPLFVREEEQIVGMIRLLTIALRVQTLLELVVRSELEERDEELSGLYEGQPKRKTKRPTAVRLLKAISRMMISVIEIVTDEGNRWHLTPLPTLLEKILSLAGVPLSVYSQLDTGSG